MTFKKRIINGVDVSKCEHLTYKHCSPMCGATGVHCFERRNCPYKQVQRASKTENKYIKALKEIKEIAEYCCDPLDKDNCALFTICEIAKEVLGDE